MTPARPVTWSDEELRKANTETQGKVDIRDPGAWTFLRTLLAALGAVHPQEHAIAKREAERGAARWTADRSSPGVNGCYSTDMLYAAIDKAYPSLLPKSPPPLVLSTGRWVRDRESFWEREGDPFPTRTGIPPTRTASDGEAFAKWLRAYGSPDEQK